MKNVVRLSLVVAFSSLFVFTSSAQGLAIDSPNYRTAIGVRGGELGGFTFKQFTGSDAAIEAILGIGYNNPRLLAFTLLYQRHTRALNVSGMKWYYGGGGHVTVIGGRSGYYRHPWGRSRYYYESDAVGLGIDGVFGLEYKIPPIPFAISFDLKPYIEVVSSGGTFWSLDPAFGVKLTF